MISLRGSSLARRLPSGAIRGRNGQQLQQELQLRCRLVMGREVNVLQVTLEDVCVCLCVHMCVGACQLY